MSQPVINVLQGPGRGVQVAASRADRPNVTPPVIRGPIEHMTDAALVAAAAAGDRDAAGTLVRRYHDDCRRFALRMMGNRHDAEDVVHDAFLRALRAIGQCRDRERFRAWLFQILANACRSALLQRRRRARWFGDDGGDGIAQLADSGMVADVGLEEQRQATLSAALQRALLRIDVRQREAFLLKYGEGMEYTDMAAVTGVGVSALKMRVKRACEALRPLLAEVMYDL